MRQKAAAWFEVTNVAEIASPALLIYLERVDDNLRRMIAMVGDVARLRPHIKTHKMRDLVARQVALGIAKCKCATIAEAEMAAMAGAQDILLAAQPVGPNPARLLNLCEQFPETKFTTIADNAETIRVLGETFHAAGRSLEVLLDIDVGQHRTGIEPGAEAVTLYQMIAEQPGLEPGGLHAYDGHISDSDPKARQRACAQAFAPVEKLHEAIISRGIPVPRVVAGGSPTFPIHAARSDVECSPGTSVFWDAGYRAKLADCDFQPAALLLARVISKPGGNRLCLDLGHKAVASEMPHPRVELLGLADARFITHSEEHLVIESEHAQEYSVGATIYAMPWHICPTVALHEHAWIIKDGAAAERWPVTARTRHLTI